MKYLFYVLYASLLLFGLYTLYEEIVVFMSKHSVEPFSDIANCFLFINTGVLGIHFSRKSIASGITAAFGSLLLTFGLLLSVQEIDASLYGVLESPVASYIASLLFIIIGLNFIIFGFKGRYLFYTTYMIFVIFGLYILLVEIELILSDKNNEPFFGTILGLNFIITGIIGFYFNRKSILSGIITAVGSLLFTHSFSISAIVIDDSVNAASDHPILAHIVAFVFFIIGLKTMIYGSNIKSNPEMPNK